MHITPSLPPSFLPFPWVTGSQPGDLLLQSLVQSPDLSSLTCEWLVGRACLNMTHHSLLCSHLYAFVITSPPPHLTPHPPQEELIFHVFYQANKVHVKGVITSNYSRKGSDKCCYRCRRLAWRTSCQSRCVILQPQSRRSSRES